MMIDDVDNDSNKDGSNIVHNIYNVVTTAKANVNLLFI